ncbi:MAG: type II toxin-antitoxin system RelB/DinJ family antitoxin [Oscillospiraceae bacterium]|jgi:DNA-damage-inducible protein J|nr:type II toxin-antitoxin system RelB/DinJ family antitoxin [Oscillospiraceae bacterium]
MATVTIRMDDTLKKQAETLFEELGLNMTSAFVMFAKSAVRRNGIPFEVTANTDPFYSESNLAELRRRAADVNAGLNMSAHALIEVNDEQDLAR